MPTAAEMRAEMPILARHEGVWEGVYRYYDAVTGQLTEQHKSRLFCRFRDDGSATYHQTNHYYWADGKVEVREFPAEYRDGRVWWDNEHIKGWAGTMLPDDHNRSTCLNWVRQGEPDLYLYEMIQISDCSNFRCRTWHWIKAGRCFQRTLIDEHKVSTNWAGYRAEGPPADYPVAG